MAVTDGVRSVRLDASDLEIEAVHQEGIPEPVPYEYDGRYLDIGFDRTLELNDAITVLVIYKVSEPRLGLYYVGPSTAEPDRPHHVWSQNEDDDARYWFPCQDDPAVKMTTSVVVAVPEQYVAVANGVPDGENPKRYWEDGYHQFNWRMDQPHPVYLMSVVVGPFSEHLEEGDDPEVRWYCLPGWEERAARAFAKTREIMTFFSAYIGIPYPWPRYGQVAVSEFVFGGMENTTLTTITDQVLPDARAALDYSADGLVAHELAHQWFGDLVTCREWAHAWLNEGFATYFDCLFREHDLGKDEFDYELLQLARGYFEEDRGRYRRALVERTWEEPIDLFDRHLYHKGAWVLHMLRSLLGERRFRRAIYNYVDRFRFNVAETSDLRRAMEDATGARLGWFFDQWVYRGGYPALELSLAPQDDDGSVAVTIVPRKSDGETYELRTELLVRAGDEEHRVSVRVGREARTIVVSGLGARPTMVVLDPDGTQLCQQTLELPTRLLQAAAEGAPSVPRRVDALRALAGKASSPAFAAITTSLRSDTFWGVRAEAAAVLAGLRSPSAQEALVEALRTEDHPKARRAIVRGLGRFVGSEGAATAVLGLLDAGDPSWFVEAEAAAVLGRIRAAGALERLSTELDRDSFNDVIRVGALDGLAALRSPEVMGPIAERTTETSGSLVRIAAIVALGRLARDEPPLRPAVLHHLSTVEGSASMRIQMALVTALGTIGSTEVIGPLSRLAEQASDGRVARHAKEAMLAIRRRADSGGGATVRDDLEALRRDQATLRDQFFRLSGPDGRE